MPAETERKFLVGETPPDLESYPRLEIAQGYLWIGECGQEIRIRKTSTPSASGAGIGRHPENVHTNPGVSDHCLAFKSGVGLVRVEIPIDITPEAFTTLWPLTMGQRIRKTRYVIPYGPHALEVDIYHDELEGLITAEAEFDSVTESQTFTPPDWFVRELTHDPRFKNQALAQRAGGVAVRNLIKPTA